MNQQQEPKRLAKPTSFEEMYPGKFLKAADLKGKQTTVEIFEVDLYELEGDGGKQIKGVLSFKGKEKKFALNRTNGICLKAMFGKNVQGWVGKRITLFPTEVDMMGETVDAVRIYGSPDIPKDLRIEVKLPKKKASSVIMHRTGGDNTPRSAPGAAAQADNRQQPASKSPPDPARSSEPSPAAWRETLAQAASLPQLEQAWTDCLAAFGDRPPIEVDDAYHNRKEALGEEAGRQLDL